MGVEERNIRGTVTASVHVCGCGKMFRTEVYGILFHTMKVKGDQVSTHKTCMCSEDLVHASYKYLF